MSEQKPMIYGDRYEVESKLASGSMGEVFVARHKLTGQHVALKVLFPNVARNVGGVERFLTEIRAASSIEHEGVIRIFDAGEDNGTFYYAMELLEGQTLGQWLAAKPRSLLQALELIHQMLGALAAAHDKGIVHRDIKPENIFIFKDHDGTEGVKLLDFSIARNLHNIRLTQTGHTLGTPVYMSPEQTHAPQRICPASDVWSVGVLLYKIVTGRVPFDAPTPQDISIRTLLNPHIPVQQLAPDVPPGLETLIDQCLAKNPAERILNAAVLQTALSMLIALPESATMHEHTTLALGPPPKPLPPSPTVPPPQTSQGKGLQKTRGCGLGLAVLLCVITAVFLGYTNTKQYTHVGLNTLRSLSQYMPLSQKSLASTQEHPSNPPSWPK